jgi:hypothetical protein
MSLFVLTIPDPSVDKKSTELLLIQRACEIAGHDVRAAGGARTSGNVIGDGGVTIASWVYTGSASS